MSPQQTSSSPRLRAWLDDVPDYSTADGEMHYYQFDVIEGVDPADLDLDLANEQQQQQQIIHNSGETSTPDNNNAAIGEDNDDNRSDTGSYFSTLTGASDGDQDGLAAQGFQWPPPRERDPAAQDQDLAIAFTLASVNIDIDLDAHIQEQYYNNNLELVPQQPQIPPLGANFTLLQLPLDIMGMITSHLPNRDRKPLRLACRDLACATPLSIPRVFLSANPRDVDVCLAIAGHPGYSSAVTELVWDDSRLPQTEADAMHYYADLLLGVRPRPLLPLGSGIAGDEEEELMMLMLQSGGQAPHWFRTCQILNDVRLIEAESRNPARSLPATATATGHMSNDWSSVGSSSSSSSHGNHGGRRAHLREVIGWYRWDARRGGVAADSVAAAGELPYDMVSEDEAAAKATRDWQYYVQLLRGRREVEESGTHIAALDIALEAFSRLQTVTVTYIAHGRGGSEQKPVHPTPTIRAFPRGFSYLVPLGWIDGRHGARLDRAIEMISQTGQAAQYGYGMPRGLDTPDGLSIVLRRLASGGISAAVRGKGKGKEQAQQRPPVELRIDDGGLGWGVDFAALISVDKNLHNDTQPGTADGRNNYDVLSQIMVQPGFKKLCLQMAGLTHEQCASHLASGAFGEILGRANGGSGLQRLELAFNAVAKEWWMTGMPAGVPTVPLGKMLTADNTAAMQHLRLSHMAVDEGTLVDVLGRLPDTIRTIVLYDVRLRNAAATGPEDSGEERWCRVVGQLRRVVGARWAAMRPRPVLRIGVSGTGGNVGRELTALGRRRWVGEAGLAAVLYGDNGGVALAQWRAGGACEGSHIDDMLDVDGVGGAEL